VFILQLNQYISDLFVLNKAALYNREYWRYVTAIFAHGNLSHLFYNLFALLFFGYSLERLIGSKRFLIVFFASGIIANILSVNYYDSSLGASGAIYGVMGCLTAINPFMLVFAFGFIMPMFLATIIWTIGDILGLFIPSNTGHIAHISGVAVGLFMGFLIRLLRKDKYRKITEYKIKIPESYMRKWEDVYIK
jgi:hypothetical protein